MRRHIDRRLQLGAARQHHGRDNDTRVVAVRLLTIDHPPGFCMVRRRPRQDVVSPSAPVGESVPHPLVPAKAGTQITSTRLWIPAFAGMSGRGTYTGTRFALAHNPILLACG